MNWIFRFNLFCLLAFVLSSQSLASQVIDDEGDIDYSTFYGRVTDKSVSSEILKISTENRNVKLFRAGDKIRFTVAKSPEKDPCLGFVRDVEEGLFVVSVKDFHPCWGSEKYFRRGTLLNFSSQILAKRIKDAGVYREVLIKRKEDFMTQLNDVNKFLWSFKQQKVKSLGKLDQQIAELKRQKQKEVEFLNLKRKDYLHLQKELIFRLDKLEQDIELYRVEKVELLRDRWALDHDLGMPVGNRPQKVKYLKRNRKTGLHDINKFVD